MKYDKIAMIFVIILMIFIMGFIRQYSFNLGLFFSVVGIPIAIMLMVEITVRKGIAKHGRDDYYKIVSDRIKNQRR